MKFEININDMAEVVLSEYGADVYNKFYEQFKFHRPAKKIEGDVLREQLWSLMQTFGPAISIGQQSPFVECRMIFEKGGR
jgi:hypothetical protein